MGHNCLANGAFLGSETIHIKNLVEIAILYHYRKDGHTSHRCHDPNMLEDMCSLLEGMLEKDKERNMGSS